VGDRVKWRLRDRRLPDHQAARASRGEWTRDQLEGDAGDGDSILPLPVFVYISQEKFEAHLAQAPAAVIRLGWDEPIVRSAVEADRERIMSQLRGDEGETVEPSAVYHLTREAIISNM
jgi:hypothetical protein